MLKPRRIPGMFSAFVLVELVIYGLLFEFLFEFTLRINPIIRGVTLTPK